jgi:hypothetical protein
MFPGRKSAVGAGPTVETMWGPERLTILGTSTACYRDSFTLTLLTIV